LFQVKANFLHSSAITHVILKKKQARHKVHSSLWNRSVKERLANDKLAQVFLSDTDYLSMPSICGKPQIHVPKERKQSLFNKQVS
jgi:hypothetical protein